VTFKEYAFQDANTLEATQTQIGTRVVTDFPLCDQEILLRHPAPHGMGVRESIQGQRKRFHERQARRQE